MTERDRDAGGRARNARPRDGLGRPLAYDAAGVERQAEGIARTPAQTLSEAQELLDAGKPFHAHEVFEDAWKTAAVDRELWKALAQVAVGLTHAARGNTRGAVALLERGAAALDVFHERDVDPDRYPYGIDVGGVAAWARAQARDLGPRSPGPSAPGQSTRVRTTTLRSQRT